MFFQYCKHDWDGKNSVSWYKIGSNYVGMVHTGIAWVEKTALSD